MGVKEDVGGQPAAAAVVAAVAHLQADALALQEEGPHSATTTTTTTTATTNTRG